MAPEKFKEYCTDVWFIGAKKFIETNRNCPFFCYISTNAPHAPQYIHEKYSKLYEDLKDEEMARFYGMIRNIDENVGPLIRLLDQLDLTNNTVLIFMTDNGSEFGEERKGVVKVEVIPDVTVGQLLNMIVKTIRRGSIVYTDKFKGKDSLRCCVDIVI